MLVRSGLFIVGLLYSLAVFASSSSSCLEKKKTDLFLREFSITKISYGVNVDLCDSRSMAHTLIRALDFLKNLGAISTAKVAISQNLIQDTPYEFFRSRVKQIVLDDGDDCVGLSQIWPKERSQKIVRICAKAVSYDTLTLTQALIHEARHMEPNEYRHEVCLDGEMRGREACDSTYLDGGAYAVGIEYLMRISRTPRLDASLREQAKVLADRELKQRFNSIPVTTDQHSAQLQTEEDTQSTVF